MTLNNQREHAEERIMEHMVAATLRVAKELWFCTTAEQVEALFKDNGIENANDRIHLIQECMGVIESFNAPGGRELTAIEEYQDELQAFVEGSWRLLAQ